MEVVGAAGANTGHVAAALELAKGWRWESSKVRARNMGANGVLGRAQVEMKNM